MGNNRKWIQIAILLAVLVVGGLTIGSSLFQDNPIPQQGSKAPDFEVPGMDGKLHVRDDLKGKAVVLNFWGTYCPPCRTEMPALQKQADKWSSSGVVVIGMNVGENAVTVKSFIDQYQIRFPIYLDENDEIRKDFGVRQYPTTFFIRPDGVIHEIRVGEMDEPYIDRTVAAMLASSERK